MNCWQWIDALLGLAGLPPVNKSMSLRAAWTTGAALECLYRLLRLRGEPPMTRFLAAQLARCHYFNIRRCPARLRLPAPHLDRRRYEPAGGKLAAGRRPAGRSHPCWWFVYGTGEFALSTGGDL